MEPPPQTSKFERSNLAKLECQINRSVHFNPPISSSFWLGLFAFDARVEKAFIPFHHFFIDYPPLCRCFPT